MLSSGEALSSGVCYEYSVASVLFIVHNHEGCIGSDVASCSLLCASQDDGAIRVWKNFADLEKNPEMVTAWQGLSDMLPTTRGRSSAWRRGMGGQK